MAPPKKSDEEKRATKHAYYLRNREATIARARANDLANPEAARERQRRWAAENRERLNALARDWRAANPERERAKQMRFRHGPLIAVDYPAMWDAQGGCCYLCGRDLAELDVIIEHDHRCCPEGRSCRNCRRGLACKDCNSAIGLAGDDPNRLRRMADALEAAQRRVTADAQLELLPETGT